MHTGHFWVLLLEVGGVDGLKVQRSLQIQLLEGRALTLLFALPVVWPDEKNAGTQSNREFGARSLEMLDMKGEAQYMIIP